MAETLKLELVSPEKLLMSKDVSAVKVPGDEGDYVVLPEHAPFMTTMRPGIVVITSDEGEQSFFVKGGFADAGPSSLTIHAEFAADCDALQGDELAKELKDANEALDKATKSAQSDAAIRHANELVGCLTQLS